LRCSMLAGLQLTTAKIYLPWLGFRGAGWARLEDGNNL
jgi:hypothetical protein